MPSEANVLPQEMSCPIGHLPGSISCRSGPLAAIPTWLSLLVTAPLLVCSKGMLSALPGSHHLHCYRGAQLCSNNSRCQAQPTATPGLLNVADASSPVHCLSPQWRGGSYQDLSRPAGLLSCRRRPFLAFLSLCNFPPPSATAVPASNCTCATTSSEVPRTIS